MLWNVKSTSLDVITFTSTSETKVHHFCQFSKAAGGQNGDFQTFLDFEKTRALWDLLIVFSKITHWRLYLGKIWRKWKFRNCRRILDIYRNWLLSFNPAHSFRLFPCVGFSKDTHPNNWPMRRSKLLRNVNSSRNLKTSAAFLLPTIFGNWDFYNLLQDLPIRTLDDFLENSGKALINSKRLRLPECPNS